MLCGSLVWVLPGTLLIESAKESKDGLQIGNGRPTRNQVVGTGFISPEYLPFA
jgi:hypothetical protein